MMDHKNYRTKATPSVDLLLANLNGAAVSAQADIRPAFANGGAGCRVTALVINADAEIIDINGAVFALCIKPEAGDRRQFKFNSPADIVDIDISERGFWAD